MTTRVRRISLTGATGYTTVVRAGQMGKYSTRSRRLVAVVMFFVISMAAILSLLIHHYMIHTAKSGLWIFERGINEIIGLNDGDEQPQRSQRAAP